MTDPTPVAVQEAPKLTGRVHDLKCWTSYYRDVASGRKPFEVRLNDRDFQAGDVLRLLDWNVDAGTYTGRECYRAVSYVLTATEFVKEGFAILGLAPLPVAPKAEPAADLLRKSLMAIKYKATSLADAQVMALRALNGLDPEEGRTTPQHDRMKPASWRDRWIAAGESAASPKSNGGMGS